MPKDNFQSRILFLSNTHTNAFCSTLTKTDGSTYKQSLKATVPSPLVFSDFMDKVPTGSIAYHPIFGHIDYRSSWRFSITDFLCDLQAAENNTDIKAHLLHIDSPGGSAFGCHEAFEAIKALQKPCIAFVETLCASAAYYLACAADKIFVRSKFSEIGSIGVMGILYNDEKWYEQEGIKIITLNSSHSPLKNKILKDATNGITEEYVTKFLDPMALQFIEDVTSVRKKVTEEALKGEVYYSDNALAAGLIDGEKTFEEVVTLIDNLDEKNSPNIDINKLNINF